MGAWAIPTFAPKLLERGEVYPTKVAIAHRIVILAAVDTSPVASEVLKKAAELARRSDGRVIVLYAIRMPNAQGIQFLKDNAKRLLADICYRFITVEGSVPEAIIRMARENQVAEIVISKRGHKSWDKVLVGSVSQVVMESSPIPVIIVADAIT